MNNNYTSKVFTKEVKLIYRPISRIVMTCRGFIATQAVTVLKSDYGTNSGLSNNFRKV